MKRHLYKYLHDHLPETQIIKQYPVGRAKADLLIGDRILVEMKLNLNKRDQFQRLLGQLDEYKEWEGSIVVLLIGSTYRTEHEKRTGVEIQCKGGFLVLWIQIGDH